MEDYVFVCLGFQKKQTCIILSEMWHSVSPQVRTSTAVRPLLCLETLGTHTNLPALTTVWLTTGTLKLLRGIFHMKHMGYV